MSVSKAIVDYSPDKQYTFLHPILESFIKENLYSGYIELDYRFRVNVKDELVVYFLKNLFYVSSKTFRQNNYRIRKLLRNYVYKNIDTNYLISFGGESYMYGLLKNCKQQFYNKSINVHNDHERNKQYYNLNSKSEVVNYNSMDLEISNDCIIVVNITKIPKNFINVINKNKSFIKRIIFIVCNHTDFNKKCNTINFTLKSSEYFIDDKLKKYFSVHIFQ
tara:strand:+ start:94011 stop:94670 length:660 start_codon:yes stop_codon:yes gene_type:complete